MEIKIRQPHWTSANFKLYSVYAGDETRYWVQNNRVIMRFDTKTGYLVPSQIHIHWCMALFTRIKTYNSCLVTVHLQIHWCMTLYKVDIRKYFSDTSRASMRRRAHIPRCIAMPHHPITSFLALIVINCVFIFVSFRGDLKISTFFKRTSFVYGRSVANTHFLFTSR